VPERRVTGLVPLSGGGYRVEAVETFRPSRRHVWTAREVVLAAGVLGTTRLLLHCRDAAQTLPGLSSALGTRVRTNSESFVAILQPDASVDVSAGTTISTDLWVDATTHVTNNRLPRSYGFMRAYLSPLVDGADRSARVSAALRAVAADPAGYGRALAAHDWHRRVTLLTVMQSEDNELELVLRRRAGRWVLTSRVPGGAAAPPSVLPQAQAAARAVAAASGGTAYGTWVDSVLGRSATAHVLGGAVVGVAPEMAVAGLDHEVFGHPGLFVADGAAVPANVGVNPSLTITAMAERAMTALAGR
jgi:cholesterol oxidase